eukprot:3938732-Prymnesium_polylepis.1
MASLAAGAPPSAEAYAERDVNLFQLADGELKAEYERYTALYLDEATDAQARSIVRTSGRRPRHGCSERWRRGGTEFVTDVKGDGARA